MREVIPQGFPLPEGYAEAAGIIKKISPPRQGDF
jgi:hypothetical protein